MVQPVRVSEPSKYIFRSKRLKCPSSTLGWPKVKIDQNHSRTTFFMFLNQTQATQRFLSHLTKFDPELNPEGPRNECYEFRFESRSELAIGMEYFGIGKYWCKDTIFNDPKMTLGSYVKGPNNMICREWVWKG